MIPTPLLLAALALAPAPGPDGPDDARTNYRPDRFETLVNPACSHCVDEARRKAGELRDDDRVLAWVRGKYDGGAIPYRWFLVPHRVISDTYGVFVYDADAGFVRGYPASLDFRFHGWRDGVMVMRRADGTLFDCLTGLAFEGPARGERLEPIPTIETDWGPWLEAQPGTVAYAMVPRFRPEAVPQGTLADSSRTRPEPDPRLGPEDRVFGLSLNGRADAWPLAGFGDAAAVRQVAVGGRPATILWDARTRTAAAYAPEAEAGSPATLEPAPGDPQAPWVDRETGSRWTVAGRSISGPRKGQALRWLPGLMVKWAPWAASYPGTALEGRGR